MEVMSPKHGVGESGSMISKYGVGHTGSIIWKYGVGESGIDISPGKMASTIFIMQSINFHFAKPV